MSGFVSLRKLRTLIPCIEHYYCYKWGNKISKNISTITKIRTKHRHTQTRSPLRLSSLSLSPSAPTVSSSNCYSTLFVKIKDKVLPQDRLFNICVRDRPYSKLYDTFDDQPQSWLFVSDSVGGVYGAQVNLDLDLEKKLSSQEWLAAMNKNLEHRQVHFDLESLVSDFKEMTSLRKERHAMEKRKDELWNEIVRRKSSGQPSYGKEIEELHLELNKGKANFKYLMSQFWSVEEKVMLSALRLPNDLHPKTPLQESTIVKEHLKEKVSTCELNHVEIGKKFDLIKFSNVGPQAYYLKGQVAHAARKLSDFACDHFQHLDYNLMTGPEFFKSPIMESCCLNVSDKEEVLTMKHYSRDIEPMNHLAGVSLMTFVGYLAKVCVGDPNVKMFSIGPRYQSVSSLGLYGATQTTQVAIFRGASQNNLESCFDDAVDSVWNFLTAFGFPMRLVQSCASSLRQEERRRVQMEIWAPSLNQFIPIGTVSDHGDYISRRQMSCYNQNHGDFRKAKLLHMVSGTAINLTTLLAVWMEHSYNMPEAFSLSELPILSNGGEEKTTIS